MGQREVREFPEVLPCLGLEAGDPVAHDLLTALNQVAAHPGPAAGPPGDWRLLAAAIARSLMPEASAQGACCWPSWDRVTRPLVLGISGGQGSGKTTLARELVRALGHAGARAAACSLDDFYLTRAERQALAASVHPLLATRGVPGTHDTALLIRTIEAVGAPGPSHLPVFDKGADDRSPEESWQPVDSPLDVLVLEGWCVGARPQPVPALEDPVNELEAREDAEGIWRRHVNEALSGPYAALWERLHGLVYLQVPDMAAVARWRTLQEQSLAAERRMTREALGRFVAHYERLTRWMQVDLPGRADLVVVLGDDHSVAGVRAR